MRRRKRRQCTLIAFLEEARCAHLAATEKQKAVDHPGIIELFGLMQRLDAYGPMYGPMYGPKDSSGADEAAGFILIVSCYALRKSCKHPIH